MMSRTKAQMKTKAIKTPSQERAIKVFCPPRLRPVVISVTAGTSWKLLGATKNPTEKAKGPRAAEAVPGILVTTC